MMFFQFALLGGYLYAHLLRRVFKPRMSFIVHSLALAGSFFFLDLDSLRIATPSSNIGVSVSKELCFAVGLPFTFLSATSPLIQAWQSVSQSDVKTYRLYAFSNMGSLAALLAYPLLVERIGLTAQATTWRFAFLSIILMTFFCGLQVWNSQTWTHNSNKNDLSSTKASWKWGQLISWLCVAASASALLISTTNILCREVAAYPFLWVLPLTLYLLSFIVCFEKPHYYQRLIFVSLLAVAAFGSVLLLHLGPNAGLFWQVFGFGALVFSGCMVCHGELYRMKPPARSLTLFYLMIATGGAIGSGFANLIAPYLFNHFYEFHLSICACLLIPVSKMFAERISIVTNGTKVNLSYSVVLLAMTGAMPVLCSLYFLSNSKLQPHQIIRWRNEYGILSVEQVENYRKMFNGQTNHGGQHLDSALEFKPNAYYSEGSGVDLAFRLARSQNNKLSIGVIGLGTGSMLSYGAPQDNFRFYEINPLCVAAAGSFFTYLDNDKAEVVIGDGRLEIEKENKSGKRHQFDILFVDAFSSDSIPVHLLTQECVEVYLNNVSENGIIVFHITNKFIDLLPVITSITNNNDLSKVLIHHENQEFDLKTKWVLASKNESLFEYEWVQQETKPWPKDIKEVKWTDERSSVASLVVWSKKLDVQP